MQNFRISLIINRIFLFWVPKKIDSAFSSPLFSIKISLLPFPTFNPPVKSNMKVQGTILLKQYSSHTI